MGFLAIALGTPLLIFLTAVLARGRRIRRALASAPRVAIAAFPEPGPARIVGRVVAGETITAPLSGRACVFYEAIVEDVAPKVRSERIREARGVPFTIDDGSGRARIVPDGAKLAVQRDFPLVGLLTDAKAAVAALAERHRINVAVPTHTWRQCREGAIQIGEVVAVYGRAVREPDPDGAARATGYRDELPTRLVLASTPDQPLLISDHDDAHH